MVKVMFIGFICLSTVCLTFSIPIRICTLPCREIKVHSAEVRDVYVNACHPQKVTIIGDPSAVRIHPSKPLDLLCEPFRVIDQTTERPPTRISDSAEEDDDDADDDMSNVSPQTTTLGTPKERLHWNWSTKRDIVTGVSASAEEDNDDADDDVSNGFLTWAVTITVVAKILIVALIKLRAKFQQQYQELNATQMTNVSVHATNPQTSGPTNTSSSTQTSDMTYPETSRQTQNVSIQTQTPPRTTTTSTQPKFPLAEKRMQTRASAKQLQKE